MDKFVEKIISLCMIHDIEIVSYGLAPNPNGFCYEVGEQTSVDACDILESYLDSLTSKQEQELKQYLFKGVKHGKI